MRYPDGYLGWNALETPAAKPPAKPQRLDVGAYFPACRLMLLSYTRDRKYLGIRHTDRSFALAEIPSDYLFVELFNEYCFACIDEVPVYKSFFARLKKDDSLSDQVKMLGIAMGSPKRQVALFRKTHGIDFPLFADEKRALFECLGRPTLPVAYLLKRQPDGRHLIVMVQAGHVADLDRLRIRVLAVIHKTTKGATGPAL
jgi:peroxiredoxin